MTLVETDITGHMDKTYYGLSQTQGTQDIKPRDPTSLIRSDVT